MSQYKEDPMDSPAFHESYGDMPLHILRMIERMNISPSDYMLLEMQFGTDFDAMRQFINLHRNPSNGSFTYPFGVFS